MISSMSLALPQQNRTLEALRGLAALLVVAGHARYALYSTSDIPTSGRTKLESIVLVPTSFGEESVALFFVLSGYLVGGQAIRQIVENRFSGREYFIKRFSRLWPVLAVSVVFTAGLDALSRTMYTNDHPTAQGRETGSLADAACNVLFLQDSRCLAYGSDEALWSIGYEWWFYMTFAAVLAGLYALVRGRYLSALMSVGVIGVGVVGYGLHLFALIPAWLMGALVAELLRRRPSLRDTSRSRRPALIAGAVTICVVGMLGGSFIPSEVLKFAIIGASAAPVILVLAAWDPVPNGLSSRPITLLAGLGEWSYTLYIFHLPILFFAGVVVAQHRWPVNPLMVYGALVGALILVRPLFWAAEAHTGAFRTWLLGLSSPRAKVSSGSESQNVAPGGH